MQMITYVFLILTQNLVCSACFGIPSLTKSAKSAKHLALNGALTMLFCTVCTALLAALRGMLPTVHLVWMTVFGVMIVCAADLAAVLPMTRQERLRAYIPQVHLAAFSSAVLGMMLKSGAVSFGAGFRTGMQMGAGYLLCCLMLAAVLPEINSKKMPASVRGWRGLLLYAGVIALAVSCMTAKS